MPTEKQLDIILESELEFKTFKQESMSIVNDVFNVTRIKNGLGHSNLTIITEEAIPDISIGSILLVPFITGYKDPQKVRVTVDGNGKPVATNLNTCIVIEYIY